MSFRSNVGKPWVEPAPTQCEMVDIHHPDCECASCKAMQDVQCLDLVVGTVYDGDVRVCAACAMQMEREGFPVAYNDGKKPAHKVQP